MLVHCDAGFEKKKPESSIVKDYFLESVTATDHLLTTTSKWLWSSAVGCS